MIIERIQYLHISYRVYNVGYSLKFTPPQITFEYVNMCISPFYTLFLTRKEDMHKNVSVHKTTSIR